MRARTGNTAHRAAISIAALATAVGLAGTAAAEETPTPDTYRRFHETALIPFVDRQGKAGATDFDDAPRLSITIGGARRIVIMDTGSTGMMIAASRIPDFDRLKARVVADGAGSGWAFLSSSKRLYVGHRVPVPIDFHGANGEVVATAVVPVLGVEATTRCPDYDSARDGATCGGKPPTTPPAASMIYMGVGFARAGDGMPQGTPDANPLLNLARIGGRPVDPGALRRGYVIDPEGVRVGLTDAYTAGFTFTKLRPDPERAGEWLAPPMCVSVNGSACAPGTLLVDTGVAQMYLTVPKTGVKVSSTTARNESTGAPVAVLDGTDTVTIRVPGTSDGADFVFTHRPNPVPTRRDAANPLAPYLTIPRRSDTRPPFVNTGRHFLRGFLYLYDADGGRIGLRWNGGGAVVPPKGLRSAG